MEVNQRVEGVDGSMKTLRKPSKPSSAFDRFAPPTVCDIEALLGWAYGTQQVHREERVGMVGASSGMMDSVVKVQMNAIHGGRIVSGGSPGLPKGGEIDAVHPDAHTIHRVLAGYDDLSIGLVINHGWLRTRPDWGGPLKLLRAMVNAKGKVKMTYDRSNNPLVSRLCEDEIEHNAGVLFQRAQYTHWWEALLMLQFDCSDSLPGLTITGPAAPQTPWESATLVRQWLGYEEA
jgi:hypothetical protein